MAEIPDFDTLRKLTSGPQLDPDKRPVDYIDLLRPNDTPSMIDRDIQRRLWARLRTLMATPVAVPKGTIDWIRPHLPKAAT